MVKYISNTKDVIDKPLVNRVNYKKPIILIAIFKPKNITLTVPLARKAFFRAIKLLF